MVCGTLLNRCEGVLVEEFRPDCRALIVTLHGWFSARADRYFFCLVIFLRSKGPGDVGVVVWRQCRYAPQFSLYAERLTSFLVRVHEVKAIALPYRCGVNPSLIVDYWELNLQRLLG